MRGRAVCLRTLRPRQYRSAGCPLRCAGHHSDGLRASRAGGRPHGRRLLASPPPAGRHLHLLRAGLGEPAGGHRLRHDGFLGHAGHHRQCAERPVQPGRVPGDLPASSGRLPVRAAPIREAQLPANAAGSARDRHAAGLSGDARGPSRAGPGRRAARPVRREGRDRGRASRAGWRDGARSHRGGATAAPGGPRAADGCGETGGARGRGLRAVRGRGRRSRAGRAAPRARREHAPRRGCPRRGPPAVLRQHRAQWRLRRQRGDPRCRRDSRPRRAVR